MENCIHPDDRKTLIHYEKQFEWPEKRHFRIIRPDGEVRWIEAKNVKKVFSYKGKKSLAFFDRDITEERKLQKVNKLYSITLDLISEGVIIFEKSSKKCVFTNQAIIEKTGYYAEDFTKRKNLIRTNIFDLPDNSTDSNKSIITKYGDEIKITENKSERIINERTYIFHIIKFI